MVAHDAIPPSPACPDAEELTAFTRGQLPEARLETIADHLTVCQPCASTLHAMQVMDELAKQLQRNPPELAHEKEPACANLIHRACAIPQAQTATATLAEETPGDLPSGPPLPAEFGAYVLLEELGEGGMGVVYKAQQKPLKRYVAIKLVKAGIYASADERARFQHEGKANARIHHNNVVQIYEFGEHQRQLYFSMELLEGGTLAQQLNEKALEPRRAAERVQELARTVEVAHRLGVVHRDLKPSNVMFTADGTVKITDFGLAKLLDDQGSHPTGEAILGTPAYMAPEQARGEIQKIGPATDVYGLGAILYEALTRRPPFQGKDKLQTLAMVCDQEPTRPSRSCRGLSLDLEAVCLKCLEKQPSQRYPSAAKLAEDLGRWLRGETTEARPRRWPVRLWRWLRRRPRLASAAALLLFLAVAVPVGLWYRDPERPRRAIEAELASGRQQILIGETQGPRWSRWSVGEATSQISVLADGTFTLTSYQSGLLELVSDPQRSHFRFSALVRHEKGMRQAEMGLYVAHCPHTLSNNVVHQFVALAFYDIERDKDRSAKAVAQPLPVKLLPRKGNPAMLDPHLYAETAPFPWEPRLYCGPRDSFDPAGVGGQDWRELAVEVTPEGVKGFWAGRAMGTLTKETLMEFTNDYLANLRKSRPEDPLAHGYDSIYDPRGGLGLYVHNGSASFHRVVIEPLD